MAKYTTIWRNKYLAGAEDADTMDKLIQVLIDSAEELRAMKEAGIEIEDQGDDYYFLFTEDAEVAEKFGLHEEEEEDDFEEEFYEDSNEEPQI